jgi:hypothetical protein
MASDGDPTGSGSTANSRTDEAKPPSDAAHLDEDAECLEDPVHCGDAQHQHAAHEHAAGRPQT